MTIKILKKFFQKFFIFWPCWPLSHKPPSARNNNVPLFFAFRGHPRNPPFLGRLAVVSRVATQKTLKAKKGFLAPSDTFTTNQNLPFAWLKKSKKKSQSQLKLTYITKIRRLPTKTWFFRAPKKTTFPMRFFRRSDTLGTGTYCRYFP
jgi:hypothetical protein